jgi:hypothetical protein
VQWRLPAAAAAAAAHLYFLQAGDCLVWGQQATIPSTSAAAVAIAAAGNDAAIATAAVQAGQYAAWPCAAGLLHRS